MNTLLEGAYWPTSLSARETYRRRHDDNDGDLSSSQDLKVTVGADGDVWTSARDSDSLRFRTWAGGGASPRVRNALLVLAEAIRRDNADRPQRKPSKIPQR